MSTLFYAAEVAEATEQADIVDLFAGPRGWTEGGKLYPVRGGRTKQFEQIGNAVTPMLAAAVLHQVL